MNVCYQADADLNQAIVTGLLRRESTIDFQTAFAAGLEGVKDLDVLQLQHSKDVFSSATIAKQCHRNLLSSLLLIRVLESLLFPEKYRWKLSSKNYS